MYQQLKNLLWISCAISVVGFCVWAGGITGNGGGTGVACFTIEAEARLARDSRKSGQRLPHKLINRIKTLQTTDYWEHKSDFYPSTSPGEPFQVNVSTPNQYLAVQESEDASAYLDRVLKTYLEPVAPSLLQEIRQALMRIHLSDEGLYNDKVADNSRQLLPFDDTGPVLNLDLDKGLCALVQIAIRQTETRVDGSSAATVYLDPELYAKLGLNNGSFNDQIVNQAALRLHEALYLLGFEMGQKTSEKVRKTVGTILNPSFFVSLQAQAQETPDETVSQAVRLPAVWMIDAVYRLGFAEFPFVDSQKISAEKRDLDLGYMELEEKTIQFSDKYAGDIGGFFSPLFRMFPTLTLRQSFMEATKIAFQTGVIDDFYAIIDPTQDAQNEIQTICNYVQAGHIQHEKYDANIMAIKKKMDSRWNRGILQLFNPNAMPRVPLDVDPRDDLTSAVYKRASEYCTSQLGISFN